MGENIRDQANILLKYVVLNVIPFVADARYKLHFQSQMLFVPHADPIPAPLKNILSYTRLTRTMDILSPAIRIIQHGEI